MLQSSAGTLAAAYTFVRHRQVDLSEARIGIAWMLVGAVAGVIAVERVDPIVLEDLLPLVLLGIVLYSVCQRRMGIEDAPPRMSRHMFYLLAAYIPHPFLEFRSHFASVPGERGSRAHHGGFPPPSLCVSRGPSSESQRPAH
jgi:uncharacterized membrane protein YfcA